LVLKELIGVYNDLTVRIYTDVVKQVCKKNNKRYKKKDLIIMIP